MNTKVVGQLCIFIVLVLLLLLPTCKGVDWTLELEEQNDDYTSCSSVTSSTVVDDSWVAISKSTSLPFYDGNCQLTCSKTNTWTVNQGVKLYADGSLGEAYVFSAYSSSDVDSCKSTSLEHEITFANWQFSHTSDSVELIIDNNMTSGYYGIESIAIFKKACDSSCTKCTGELSSNCTSCAEGYYLVTTTCTACYSTCRTCTGGTYDECTSCISILKLYNDTCINSCPTNVYLTTETLDGYSFTQCNTCYFACATCDGSGDNNCISCLSTYTYITADRSCCDTTCLTCSGAFYNECLTCSSSYIYFQGQCVTSCPEQYWLRSSDTTCQPCDPGCKTCVLSNIDCKSCNSGYFLSNGYCPSSCPSGQYGDTSTNKCVSCSTACAQCYTTASLCSSCNSGYYLYGTQCLMTCPTGTFPNTGTLQCTSCHTRCSACTGASYTNCQGCTTGYYLWGSTCSTSCPSSYYPSSSTNNCEQCDSLCLTCTTSSTNCQSCIANYYLHNNYCVNPCPTGYYGDTTVYECKSCFSGCTTCTTTSINCQSCSNGYYLDGNTCGTSCSSGSFANINTRTCDACFSYCSLCSGNANTCSSCKNGYYLMGTTCGTTCPTSYYGDSSTNTCKSCDSKCVQCVTLSTNCQSCATGYYLSGSTCGSTCPNGYWADASTLICQTCNSQCSQCEGPSNSQCTSCPSNRILDGNYCKLCSDYTGYYADPLNPRNCLEICGDGIRVSDLTECDDGNLVNLDGCSSTCTIESPYICYGGSSSSADTCHLPAPISFTQTYPTSDFSSKSYYNIPEQYYLTIYLQFGQQLYFGTGKTLEDYISISIVNKDGQFANFILEQDQSDVTKYTLKIQFKTSIVNRQILVSLVDSSEIRDSQYNYLASTSFTFAIKEYYYYSPTQRSSSDKYSFLIEMIVYFVQLTIALTLLTGDFFYIQSTYDFINYVLFLGYIDVRFPLCGVNFFTRIQHVLFEYVPNIAKIFTSFEQSYSNTPNSFSRYEIGNHYIVSIGSILSLLIIYIVVYLIVKIFHMKIIYPRGRTSYYWLLIDKFVQTVFQWQGFISLFFLFFMNLQLYALLVFQNIDFTQDQFTLNFFVCIIVETFLGLILISALKFIAKKQPVIFDQYEVGYNEKIEKNGIYSYRWRMFWFGLNKENLFSLTFSIIAQCIRKIIFTGVIIFLNKYTVIQILSLLGINLAMLLIIKKKKPYVRMIDNVKMMMQEGSLILGTTFFIFLNLDTNENESLRSSICWGAISLLSIGFFFNLIVSIIDIYYSWIINYFGLQARLKIFSQRELIAAANNYKVTPLPDYLSTTNRGAGVSNKQGFNQTSSTFHNGGGSNNDDNYNGNNINSKMYEERKPDGDIYKKKAQVITPSVVKVNEMKWQGDYYEKALGKNPKSVRKEQLKILTVHGQYDKAIDSTDYNVIREELINAKQNKQKNARAVRNKDLQPKSQLQFKPSYIGDQAKKQRFEQINRQTDKQFKGINKNQGIAAAIQMQNSQVQIENLLEQQQPQQQQDKKSDEDIEELSDQSQEQHLPKTFEGDQIDRLAAISMNNIDQNELEDDQANIQKKKKKEEANIESQKKEQARIEQEQFQENFFSQNQTKQNQGVANQFQFKEPDIELHGQQKQSSISYLIEKKQ